MKKLRLSKTSRTNFLTYAMVIILFVALQVMANGGMLSSSLKKDLVALSTLGGSENLPIFICLTAPAISHESSARFA